MSPDIRVTEPDRVDLREYLWGVPDIGLVPASAAQAVATLLEFHCGRLNVESTNLSALFIHYNARVVSGQQNADVGTTIQDALKAVIAHGACRNQTWPMAHANVMAKPPEGAYEEARPFSKVDYRYPADPFEALALQYPIAVTVKAPIRCLDEAGRTGVMPTLSANQLAEEADAFAHALVITGYDKPAKTFTARNCWGEGWGQDGYCTISFDMLRAIAPFGTEAHWVITTPQAGVAGAAAGPVAAAAAQPAAPERLSDLAAKLKQDIRGDLQRDLAESARRIREMVGRPGGGQAQPGTAAGVCPACQGARLCPRCGGPGCDQCGNSGRCAQCGGRGTV